MSSSDFLKQMLDASEKWSGSGGGGIVSRIKIEFGLHRYVAGHDYWSFWKPVSSPGDWDRVGNELTGRLQQAGCTDAPVRGIKVTIDKNVLSRNEPYRADLQEFVPEWQKDAFKLLGDHISDGNIPFGDWFYGRIEYKANPFFVKKGEAGKTETDQNGSPRFPSLRIPVEKYANEQTARAAAGSDSDNSQAVDNSQWSDTARKHYEDISVLIGLAEQVSEWYTKMIAGTPFNNDAESYPLPSPLTPPAVKNQLAELYAVESADIDLLMSADVAF